MLYPKRFKNGQNTTNNIDSIISSYELKYCHMIMLFITIN